MNQRKRRRGCRVCGEKITDGRVFRHYLDRHPLVAAVTWNCCIPRELRCDPSVAPIRAARGWLV